VTRLSEAARRTLHDLDQAAGHDYLAKQWSVGPLEKRGAAVQREVYSLLEDQETLYAISSATGSAVGRAGQTWTFAGRDLVAWLEYGTGSYGEGGAYPITPVHAKQLAFPAGGGGNHTAFLSEPGGLADFLEPEKSDLQFRDAVPMHPGFPGDHFIRQTQEIIERKLAAEANYTASRVSARLV
jgi:hypothetical protein